MLTENSASATRPSVSPRVQQQILEEIEAGNYLISSTKPKVVSALAVVNKPNGDIRLIHDLSRPHVGNVNSYASKDQFSYQTVYDALKIVKPHSYMAMVDLKNAYRSVHISPEEHTLTGLAWAFADDPDNQVYLTDARLPSGPVKAPPSSIPCPRQSGA